MAYVLVPSGIPRFARADGVEHWLVPPPACPQCSAPIPASFTSCDYCDETPEFAASILQRVVASTLYLPDERPPWPHNAELVALKRDGSHAAAFAEALAHVLASTDVGDFDAVVPIPSTTTREHPGPLALANALGRRLDRPVQNLLRHVRQVAPQKSLKRDRRFDNVAGALIAAGPCASARILLVDDVATTCATLLEAARALAAQGARVCVGAVAGRHTSGQALRQAGHCVWVD